MDHIIELLEFLHSFFSEGLSWASGVAVILGALKIIEGRRKHWEQRELNRKIDALGEHLGVPVGASKTLANGRTNYGQWLSLSRAAMRRGFHFGRKKHMKINKAILVPLLAAIVEFVKQCTGYEVPFGNNVDMIADGILWAIATGGVFLHPKKDVLSDAEKNYISSP